MVDILRILNEYMLLNEDESRASAKQVFRTFDCVFKALRKQFEVPVEEGFSMKDELRKAKDTDEPPRIPPGVPPGYLRRPGAFSSRLAGAFASTSTSAREVAESGVRPQSPSPQRAESFRRHHFQATYGDHKDQQHEASFRTHYSSSVGLYDIPDPPSHAALHQSSQIDRFNAPLISTQDPDHPPVHRRPHTIGKTSDLRHQGNEPFHSLLSGPDPSNEDPKSTPLPALSLLEKSHTKRSPSVIHSPEYKDQRPPHLSLHEGLEWKKRKKKGDPSPLHGEENLTSLNQRDHVGFLFH